MLRETSVVTPERFAKGFAYQDYIAQIKVNLDRFEQYYESATLKNEDAEFFRQAVQGPDGPAKVLVVGEDWCPDVYRGLPVMARIAEASGMELRVFPRDENLDIMSEFLNQGEFQSIPTFVFYTREHRYITHWIERPALANQDRVEITAQVKGEMPEADDQEVRRTAGQRTIARYPAWQQETVRELRELLA